MFMVLISLHLVASQQITLPYLLVIRSTLGDYHNFSCLANSECASELKENPTFLKRKKFYRKIYGGFKVQPPQVTSLLHLLNFHRFPTLPHG